MIREKCYEDLRRHFTNLNQPVLNPWTRTVIDDAAVVRKVLKGIEKNNPQDLKVEDAFDLDKDPKEKAVTDSKLMSGDKP